MRVLGVDIHGQSLDWVRGVTGVLLLLLSWLDSLPVAVELGVVDLLPSRRETSSRTTSRISFLHKVRLVRRHLWLGKSRKIMSYYVNIISMRTYGFKLLFAVCSIFCLQRVLYLICSVLYILLAVCCIFYLQFVVHFACSVLYILFAVHSIFCFQCVISMVLYFVCSVL